MTGTLYGIGIGPGDPELITLKALRVLQSVPVLAWPAPEDGPSLAREIITEYLNGTQREIPIRMPLLSTQFPAKEIYDRASAEISMALSKDEDVAVICEGDPFFYGSFIYLYGRLMEEYPIEVIPGVSSLTACAAVLGAPLSAKNDILTILPAPLDKEILKCRLAASDSVAIIKVGRHFEKIINILEELGLSGNAKYIERATMHDQRILPIMDCDGANVPYFSMILVHKRNEAWK